MNDKEYLIALENILSTREGRLFIAHLLSECGVDLLSGISYRTQKTAHELGLDLLHKIVYNDCESLKQLISEQKTLEVNNGRGSRGSDDLDSNDY